MTVQGDAEAIIKLEDFLSCLPKEPENGFYNYQGHWTPAFFLQGIIPFQTNFEAIKSDIFLVTLPKSGTTWLKAILFAVLNRVQYPVTSPQHPLLVCNPHDLVPFIDIAIYGKSENPDLSCFKNPRLFSTHLPYVSLPQSIKDSKCKIVYLCRNPKDTFISYWHFLNNFNGNTTSIEDCFEQFYQGVSSCGPYWDHVLGYWEKCLEMHENIFFLKYEEMKEEPLLCLKKLTEFLGCPFSLEEEAEASRVPDEILKLCSFDNLSNLEANKNGNLSSISWIEKKVFFRHGKVGDWKNFLTEVMMNRLDDLTQERFKAYGLEF